MDLPDIRGVSKKSVSDWVIVLYNVERYNIIWDVVEHNMIQETRWCYGRWNMTRCTHAYRKIV